ncbi:hypothetical protein B0H14DRAFT_3153046 [Mycena olivaceomarginata]|nr:hypothetical protein B0H14DRAFT_3153046 [Mycena olivaceomarginata]
MQQCSGKCINDVYGHWIDRDIKVQWEISPDMQYMLHKDVPHRKDYWKLWLQSEEAIDQKKANLVISHGKILNTNRLAGQSIAIQIKPAQHRCFLTKLFGTRCSRKFLDARDFTNHASVRQASCSIHMFKLDFLVPSLAVLSSSTTPRQGNVNIRAFAQSSSQPLLQKRNTGPLRLQSCTDYGESEDEIGPEKGGSGMDSDTMVQPSRLDSLHPIRTDPSINLKRMLG